MIGFLVGTVCLIGLIATIRRGRCGYGYQGGWGGRCGGGWGHGHGRWHGGGDVGDHHDHGHGHGRGGDGSGRARWFMRMISQRLDATPAQEKVIFEAFQEVRDAMRGAKDRVRTSRSDVATAFRGEHFSAEHMGDLFGKHDEVIDSVRRAFVGALSKVHDALDDRQRKIFADLVENGGFFGRRWGGGGGWNGGPYRGGWA